MQINARRIVAVGTALWFVAFVVLLPFWGWLGRHDHRIWLWTCLAGWLLGLLGWLIMTGTGAHGPHHLTQRRSARSRLISSPSS